MFCVTLKTESDARDTSAEKQQHFLPEVWAFLHFYFSVQEKMRHRVSIFATEDIQHRVHKGCFSEMVWKFSQVRDLHRTPFHGL